MKFLNVIFNYVLIILLYFLIISVRATHHIKNLMVEVWKHINSYDTPVISPTFQLTRSSWYPVQLKRINSKGSQSKSFYKLVPTLWNDLPPVVREAECRNTFKNRLDMHWRGHPMRLYHKAPYGQGIRSPAHQEEVIYEIASHA